VSLTPLTTKKVDFQVEYLCEYEAVSRGSGAQMEFLDEKTEGRKSRDRIPFNKVLDCKSNYDSIFSSWLI
jgi:hypothetical protein